MTASDTPTELLPCPFCGGEAEPYEADHYNSVTCRACVFHLGSSKPGIAAKLWNRRVSGSQSQGSEATTRAPVPEPAPAELFTCPDCESHYFGTFGAHLDDRSKWIVQCHDQHRTRCTWSGPYEEFVKS